MIKDTHHNLPHASAWKNDTPTQRLSKRFLDRLVPRMKEFRRLLIERKWEVLKEQTLQLAKSAEYFEFSGIAAKALSVYHSIPEGRHHPATALSQAKEATDTLIRAMDQLLIDHLIQTRRKVLL